MIDFDAEVLAACNEEFGRPVSYQPYGDSAFEIEGVFTDGYKSPALGEDGFPTWTTTAPTLGIRASDLRIAPTKNDRVTIEGKQYMVTDCRADGVGWLILPLKVT